MKVHIVYNDPMTLYMLTTSYCLRLVRNFMLEVRTSMKVFSLVKFNSRCQIFGQSDWLNTDYNAGEVMLDLNLSQL